MLLPGNIFDTEVAERNWGVNGLIVTVASVVEPFLLPQHREKDTSEVEATAWWLFFTLMLGFGFWSNWNFFHFLFSSRASPS